ncbi:ubiquitin-like domain-containing protein [Pengzhenrongella sp.]|uniref:aggregation-promoting factor C-terminal-like domain-containing protein n=1 Tax=Pengzhenrongella sp. TaxID=2888820 RepID=UPI002F93817C
MRVRRLAAQGLVLVMVTGGTSAFAIMHKTVTVDVDGKDVHVTAFGRTVGDVLAGAGIPVGKRDVVAPNTADDVTNGSQIVVRHGRYITVEVNGADRNVWTTGLTVGEAVGDIGVRSDNARVSASRSASLGRNEVLRVSTQKTIHVVVDHQMIDGVTTASTVRDALKELGLVLRDGDQLSVPLDATAVEGLVILVTRAEQSSGTTTEAMPFTEKVVNDPTRMKGTRTVTTPGRAGERQVTFATSWLGGAAVERQIVAQVVLRAPVQQVVSVGTMVVSKAPVPAPGTAQAIGRQLAAARGWGDDQFSCLLTLWNHESGWNIAAANPASSAYGIPQALPGSKMASVAADWKTNPTTQITWGLEYIAGRYKTPCGAWQIWSTQGWY